MPPDTARINGLGDYGGRYSQPRDRQSPSSIDVLSRPSRAFAGLADVFALPKGWLLATWV